MRLLIATPFPPEAAGRHGGGVYLGTLVGALAEAAEVAVVSFATLDELSRRAHPPDSVRRSWLVARPRPHEVGGVTRAGLQNRAHLRVLHGCHPAANPTPPDLFVTLPPQIREGVSIASPLDGKSGLQTKGGSGCSSEDGLSRRHSCRS